MISPSLANVYLHYALDLWAERAGDGARPRATWRSSCATPTTHRRFPAPKRTPGASWQQGMRERLREFALSLHAGERPGWSSSGALRRKTASGRGLGKPETFDLPGLHLHLAETRRANSRSAEDPTGYRAAKAKLQADQGQELRAAYASAGEFHRTGEWLERVVRGDSNYHAVPTNGRVHWTAFRLPRHRPMAAHAAGGRSQKGRLDAGADRRDWRTTWLSKTDHLHPWPDAALRSQTPKAGSRTRRSRARTVLWGGASGNTCPDRDPVAKGTNPSLVTRTGLRLVGGL